MAMMPMLCANEQVIRCVTSEVVACGGSMRRLQEVVESVQGEEEGSSMIEMMGEMEPMPH